MPWPNVAYANTVLPNEPAHMWKDIADQLLISNAASEAARNQPKFAHELNTIASEAAERAVFFNRVIRERMNQG